MNFSNLQFEMRWLWVTSLMCGNSFIVGIRPAFMERFQQLYSFYLGHSAHVVALICVKDLNLVYFATLRLQFDLLSKVVHLKRVTLLHDNLGDILTFELFVAKKGNELHCDFLSMFEVHFGMYFLKQLFHE